MGSRHRRQERTTNGIYLGRMRPLLAIATLLPYHLLHGQGAQEARATYSLVLSRTATMEAAEAQCIEQARLKAVGDAFGYTVQETTLGHVADTREKFEDNFSVLSRTSVEGEWLGDAEPPAVAWGCESGAWTVTATVHGLIRAFGDRATADVELEASPGNGAASGHFRQGQPLHAGFRASRSGHLSVFFIDHAAGRAYRVFPAMAYAELDHLPVEADRRYDLFDRVHATQFPDHPAVTELIMEVPVGQAQTIDELVAVYAPAPYAKPLLSRPASPDELPGMGTADLEMWLTTLRQRDPQAVVKRAQLTVVR